MNSQQSQTKQKKPATPSQQPIHKFTAPNHQPVFCEGLSQIAVGFPVSRLIFNSQPAQHSEDGSEVTHFVATEIVLPTLGLAELAKQIIISLANGSDQLETIGTTWNREMMDLIKQLQATQTPK